VPSQTMVLQDVTAYCFVATCPEIAVAIYKQSLAKQPVRHCTGGHHEIEKCRKRLVGLTHFVPRADRERAIHIGREHAAQAGGGQPGICIQKQERVTTGSGCTRVACPGFADPARRWGIGTDDSYSVPHGYAG